MNKIVIDNNKLFDINICDNVDYDIYGKKADEPMVLCVCVNAPHPEETAAFIKFLGFE